MTLVIFMLLGRLEVKNKMADNVNKKTFFYHWLSFNYYIPKL